MEHCFAASALELCPRYILSIRAVIGRGEGRSSSHSDRHKPLPGYLVQNNSTPFALSEYYKNFSYLPCRDVSSHNDPTGLYQVTRFNSFCSPLILHKLFLLPCPDAKHTNTNSEEHKSLTVDSYFPHCSRSALCLRFPS